MNDNLAIATHGRSFYVLDHIEPLRQYSAKLFAGTDPILFRPAPAVRGANEPATIQYVLRQPAKDVRLEMRDSKGTLVRSYPDTANAANEGAAAVAAGAAAVAPAAALGQDRGHEHVPVGPAVRAAGLVPGDDPLGRRDDRPRSRAGQVHRATHGRRPHGLSAARRQAPSAARGDRRRPRGADDDRPSPSATRSARRTAR